MTWIDERLSASNLSFDSESFILPSYVLDHIWTPDPYITNSKDAGVYFFRF